MSASFSAEETAVIVEAGLSTDEDGAVARLTETFRGTLRLRTAIGMAERIRAGESVDLGDGTVLERDAP